MAEEQYIYLGLGSNMHDRYQSIKKGIKLLNDHPHIWVTDQSHVYQSPPMYNIDQEDFYNMVIKLETNLTPLDLLGAIKSIEVEVGRQKERKRNMPRILDIDILTFGDLQIHSNLLEIPHPKIMDRKFVLKPWNDIDPDYLVPNYSAKVSEMLENTEDESDIRLVLIFDKDEII
jgi:2-amino-4-hydroxy-6-hydroxymethyldihydropteridine diphosphokinase